MHANRVRCSNLVAVPVVVPTGVVTKIMDADDITALIISGVQNRTGVDGYFAYSTTAPADSTTMILLVDKQNFMVGIGDGFPVGNLYYYHAAGVDKTAHAIKGY